MGHAAGAAARQDDRHGGPVSPDGVHPRLYAQKSQRIRDGIYARHDQVVVLAQQAYWQQDRQQKQQFFHGRKTELTVKIAKTRQKRPFCKNYSYL